jgi:hypothetical protein
MLNRPVSRWTIRLLSGLALASLLVMNVGFLDVSTVRAIPVPDLEILSLSFSPSSPYTNDDVNVEVLIQNSGAAAATAFHIDVYVDDTPTGCSDPGDHYNLMAGLAAGVQTTISVTYPAGEISAGAHDFRAFVDSDCEVFEGGNEGDNISAAFPLTVSAAPAAPVHDDIASAKTIIPPFPYWNAVDVSGATRAVSDPPGQTCVDFPGMASVWYQATPSKNMSVKFDTVDSNYDTYIAVWSGSPGALSPVGCDDDHGPGRQSILRLDLTGGTHYYFEVAQFTNWSGDAGMTAASMSEGTREAAMAPAKWLSESEVTEQAGGDLRFQATADLRVADFDNDGMTDMGYFHSSTGLWGVLKSGVNFTYSNPLYLSWGQTGDIAVSGDYDGDHQWDPTVRRPPAGGQSAAYLMLLSSTGYDYGSSLTVPAGWPGLGDTPVVGDFNGDGKSDPAIWRGNAGVWIIPMSPAFNTYQFYSWGTTGDTPVGADVDGDGQADVGYWRPSTGVWGFLQSTHAYSFASPLFFSWGQTGDIPVMADYDGDGKADPAVVIPPAGGQSRAYRILLSTQAYDPASSLTIPAGWPGLGDTPVPADYDDDGKADVGIWRSTTGVWIIPSSASPGTYTFRSWGASGDQVAR